MAELDSTKPTALRAGPLGTFRAPYFARYWLSTLLQFLAFAMQMIGLQWLITDLTPSRTALGLVGFVQGTIVAGASPVAGVAVDRFPKRNLMVICRAALALIIVVLMVLVMLDVIRIWHIIVASVGAGLVEVLMQPASQTYVFDIVKRDRVQSAVALNSAGTGIAQMAGPALAGVVIAAVGVVGAFGSATAGLVLGVFLLWTIPIPGHRAEGTGGSSALSELREGLSYVVRSKPVMLTLIVCSMAIFNGSLFAMRPVFARYVLDVGSVGYGLMAGMSGVGAIVGALVASILPPMKRPGLAISFAMGAYGFGIFLYSFAFSFAYILVVEFLIGLVGQIWNIATFSGLQMSVPAHMRGRVISLVWMVVQLAFIGQLFVGILADAVSDQFALGLFGILPTVGVALIVLFGYRSLRDLTPIDLDDPQPAPAAAGT